MAVSSTANELEKLQLSNEDTEDLWNPPSERETRNSFNGSSPEDASSPKPRQIHDSRDTLFDRQDAREAALRNELQTVRNINEVIEGLLSSIECAKGNMEVSEINPTRQKLSSPDLQAVSRTITSASTLLNTWTRILSQTEHNQRLILNPNWHGATQDGADMENEEIQRRQAAERREQALQQQREAAARKTEEEERRRAQGTKVTRGTGRGTFRATTSLGRKPSVSTSRTATTRGSSTTATRRPVSGIARGGGVTRGRGRP